MNNADKPAYPITDNEHRVYENGLTKREKLAGMTMQGLLSNPNDSDTEPEYLATLALKYADALLTELENT